MKIFSLLLGILLVTPHVVYGGRYCKNEKSMSFSEQLAKLEPKADLDLVDVELFPKGNVVAGYEYAVDSAYTKGLYSRTDSWQIVADASPEKLRNIADGIDYKIGAGLEIQSLATFTRFFKDPCLAMKAIPYSPKRIPLTSKVALGPKFHVGDYFLFRGSAGFVLSAELLQLLSSGPWGVGLSGSYLIQGYYQVHIVRLNDKQVRLKVVAHRGTTKAGSIGVGFESEFEVFGWNALNNGLEKFVNTKPVKLQVDQKKSSVVIIDYVLDLTDPEVTKAFEEMFPKMRDIKNFSLINEFKKMGNLESNFVMDVTPLEELYLRDYQSSNVGRIQRNLKTSSNQNLWNIGVQVGNKLLGYKYDHRVSTAMMSVRKEDDTVQKYLLKSWEDVNEGRVFISWIRNVNQEYLRALFSANDNYVELRPVNIVKHINKKRSSISYRTFQALKDRMKRLLPDEIYTKIPWHQWNQTRKQKFENFGLRFELAITPELILNMPQLKKEEIKILFRRYFDKKNLKETDLVNIQETDVQTNQGHFDDYLNKMADSLEKALDRSKHSKDRVEYISDLRGNPIFDDMGLGFLISLTPDKIEEWSNLDLDISSNDALIEYSYGDVEMTRMYKKILTIKAALDDDALDPLREAESISIPQFH